MNTDMDQNYVIILFILICRIYELNFQGLRNKYNMNIVENSSFFSIYKNIATSVYILIYVLLLQEKQN